MMRFNVASAGLLVHLVGFVACAADVTGSFVETGSNIPLRQAPITVEVDGKDRQDLGTTTDDAGKFIIKNCPAGQVVLRFFKTDYVNYPTVRVVPTDGSPVDADARPKITDDYFKRILDALHMQTQAGNAGAVSETWVKLKSTMNAEEAVQCAKLFAEKSPELAAKAPEIATFASVDTQKVKEFQAKVTSAEITPQKIPSLQSVAGQDLPKAVVGHAIADQVLSRVHTADDLKTAELSIKRDLGEDYSAVTRASMVQLQKANPGRYSLGNK